MEFIIFAIGVIIWMIVGFVLLLPYAWLAGGVYDITLSTVMMLVAPAVILALVVIIYGMRRFSITREEKRKSLAAFWTLLIVVNLPIILRFASIGLKSLSYAATADFVFRYRFWSTPMAIVIIILVSMAGLYRLFKKLDKKPELQQ